MNQLTTEAICRRYTDRPQLMLEALAGLACTGTLPADADTDALHQCRSLLIRLPADTLRRGLTQILCGKFVKAALTEYRDVIAAVISEAEPMFDFEQHNPYHCHDVWMHTVTVIENIPAVPRLRWAALFHDMGKPSVFFQDENGIGHFYGHADKSVVLAGGVMDRLGFDAAEKDYILLLVKKHDHDFPTTEQGFRRLLRKYGLDTVLDFIAIHRADTAGQSAKSAPRFALYDEIEQTARRLAEQEPRAF